VRRAWGGIWVESKGVFQIVRLGLKAADPRQLCAPGFYVQYGSNNDFRPGLVSEQRWRYRLTQGLEATESFSAYKTAQPAWIDTVKMADPWWAPTSHLWRRMSLPSSFGPLEQGRHGIGHSRAGSLRAAGHLLLKCIAAA